MDLQDPLEWASIEWPSSASAIIFEVESGIDSLALIRFQIEAADLDNLTKSLGFSRPLRPGFHPFPLQKDAPTWWTPYRVAEFIGGSVLSSGLSREIVVDQSDPKGCTIFLRIYQV